MRWKRLLKRAGLGTLVVVLGLGAWLGYLQFSGNFHEVLPGKFYRSAQLSPEALAGYIDRYGIATVINLRGENPQDQWYRDEMKAVQDRGAVYLNFRMSAKRELTMEESFRLVALMRDAKGPILVHCQGGADRTGFASVLYLQQIAGVDEETAELQLTPLFGHLNLPFLGAYAMDETWEAFEKAIGLDS
ncbi:dual specificity protein phosphatase family protein [Ciceribacter sp. L1K22]|uniref:dual specificity protein phosphatase family protein n=1 Tax=Ciceribacter sp. L1K22 TaxID=2820275 RepID=UPI001ABDE98E|nr:dual specificity protein phosphatase family protein [Ciceribacter sp. L1K22]MBO3761111.1 dual specificity protein phosphatase family protein [Ciceribacter sp. L1K22]